MQGATETQQGRCGKPASVPRVVLSQYNSCVLDITKDTGPPSIETECRGCGQ